jgi:hypothetical protein
LEGLIAVAQATIHMDDLITTQVKHWDYHHRETFGVP